MDLDEQEQEFDRLHSSLDRQAIIAFAQQRSAILGYRSAEALHLMAVGELAGKYVDILCYGEDRLATRYRRQVCESAGFLHHAMLQGCAFEEVAGLSDEAVARIVSACTPDVRQPGPRRRMLLANQLGLSGREAQLVKLADLRHECSHHEKHADVDPGRARIWLDESFPLLSHLRHLLDSRLAQRVGALRAAMNRLDARLKAMPT